MDPGLGTNHPKSLFSLRDRLLSRKEKFKWVFPDSGRKTGTNDLAGIIFQKRKKGTSVLEWARMW